MYFIILAEAAAKQNGSQADILPTTQTKCKLWSSNLEAIPYLHKDLGQK